MARAQSITLAEAGLRERQHLQEWVLEHPEMVGGSLWVITSECDRWSSARGRERDRLDVLALDPDGHLVVVELKRDEAPETVELQAIKYAAYCSRFTPETLVEEYCGWLERSKGERHTWCHGPAGTSHLFAALSYAGVAAGAGTT